jgi:hypothetical protein
MYSKKMRLATGKNLPVTHKVFLKPADISSDTEQRKFRGLPAFWGGRPKGRKEKNNSRRKML